MSCKDGEEQMGRKMRRNKQSNHIIIGRSQGGEKRKDTERGERTQNGVSIKFGKNPAVEQSWPLRKQARAL
ncbi:putative MFS-type transporter C18.02 [Fusarium oxysporum f. sp. albedinis]|nr:putative MFS-type transporter C18.02 [Fusarium oxysporum f. sp. albedinis]